MTTIKRVEVKTYLERLYCDCGGEMLPTGIVLTTDPPYYPHRCQVCDKKDNYIEQAYPRLAYDEIDG